jgi:hypothetical protein
VQAVAFVLVFGAARAGVNAVLGLEVLGQLVDVDRLDIAADGVLHLNAIARVLERDPLHSILILSNDKRSCGRDRTGRGVGVHIGASGRSSVHIWRANRRALRRGLRRAESRWGSLELRRL